MRHPRGAGAVSLVKTLQRQVEHGVIRVSRHGAVVDDHRPQRRHRDAVHHDEAGPLGVRRLVAAGRRLCAAAARVANLDLMG